MSASRRYTQRERGVLRDASAILGHAAKVGAGVDEMAHTMGSRCVRKKTCLRYLSRQPARVVEAQLHGVDGVNWPGSGGEKSLRCIDNALKQLDTRQGGKGGAFD